jgi:hypothetical protein
VYFFRPFAAEGGLISYGPDIYDILRRSASYVDRILKGANPADLPVQQPSKYELVINLKTAKALGLDVPLQLLYRDRRGDRISFFAALHESVSGTERPKREPAGTSAFEGKPALSERRADRRF